MNRVCIIAEAGVNHNGDVQIAKQLVDAAAMAGADIIKFQTFDPKSMTSCYAEMAEYQRVNIGETKSQREMLEDLTLSHDDFRKLADYCNFRNIRFLSTPFDIESIVFLKELNNGLWKIPSGEITNYPYLKTIAQTGGDIIMSTGMSTVSEVQNAVSLLKSNGSGKISLMHCTTDYPTNYEDVNLLAMITLKNLFQLDVGYSDHTRGIEISIAAAAMGATIIEKHFTLSRKMKGPDHKASLEPDELASLVKGIRHVSQSLGDGIKKPTDREMLMRATARKSIVAKRDITKGELFSEDNITTKRPGTGVDPMLWENVIGTISVRSFKEDELITL